MPKLIKKADEQRDTSQRESPRKAIASERMRECDRCHVAYSESEGNLGTIGFICFDCIELLRVMLKI